MLRIHIVGSRSTTKKNNYKSYSSEEANRGNKNRTQKIFNQPKSQEKRATKEKI